MITWLDHALAATIAVVWPLVGYYRFQGFRRRVRAGVAGAKLAEYCSTMLEQWMCVFAVALLWARSGRDAAELGLQTPAGPGALWGISVAVLVSAFFILQAVTIARRPAVSERTRAQLAKYADLLPASRSDISGFLTLSVTAGICEEILFRGMLVWYFAHWFGPWGAQGVALLLFGAAHIYLGAGGAIRSILAGAAVAGLYIWTGSLWASMLLHAVIDATSGWIGYAVLTKEPQPPDLGSSPAPVTN